MSRHILYVVYNASLEGSVYAVARRQAEYLAKLGEKVTVISNKCPASWQGVETFTVNAFDSPIWRLLDYLLVRITNRLPKSWRKRWDMCRVLAQYRFSFSVAKAIIKHFLPKGSIHACVCIQHFSIPGLEGLKKNQGVPLILVSLGDIFDHPEQAFSRPTNLLYRRSAVSSYQLASLVVVVGKQLKKRAIDCGAKSTHVKIIPNGIDLDYIRNRTNPICRKDGRDLQLLYVGRLSPEKGVEILLRALAKVGDRGIHLQIIGRGPDREALQSLAHDLDIVDKVEFWGHVSEDILWERYNCSDLVVIPSYADALPLVSLEAQAFGLPVIASEVGGLPDVIESNVNGILIPAGNVEAMSSAIISMYDNPAMRKRMSDSGLEMIKRFDWKQVLNRFTNEVLQFNRQS